VSGSDEQLASLRDELLQAQSQRLDLARFKLVAIAVLGSVALGANVLTNGEGAALVMGLVPLTALYIDSLGDAKKIQFFAIGSFLRQKFPKSLLGDYEKFCEDNREVFHQNYAYKYSTALVSLGIVAIGVARLVLQPDAALLGIVEILSGSAGVMGAASLARSTAAKLARLGAS
jgi:hypothetical protein